MRRVVGSSRRRSCSRGLRGRRRRSRRFPQVARAAGDAVARAVGARVRRSGHRDARRRRRPPKLDPAAWSRRHASSRTSGSATSSSSGRTTATSRASATRCACAASVRRASRPPAERRGRRARTRRAQDLSLPLVAARLRRGTSRAAATGRPLADARVGLADQRDAVRAPAEFFVPRGVPAAAGDHVARAPWPARGGARPRSAPAARAGGAAPAPGVPRAEGGRGARSRTAGGAARARAAAGRVVARARGRRGPAPRARGARRGARPRRRGYAGRDARALAWSPSRPRLGRRRCSSSKSGNGSNGRPG